jgi:carboxypeptidase C (cathepsin A)
MQAALAVPTYTAAAFTNGMLAPPLSDDRDAAVRSAREWAMHDYAPALARLDALTSEQRAAIRTELARYTGVKADRIDQKTLVIPLEQFAITLLRDRGQVLGRYDTRMTGPLDTLQKEFDPTIDPSLKSIIDDRAVVRYIRDELGFESDLRYQGPFGGGYPPPTSFRGDWMSVKWNWRPPVDSTMPVDTLPPLERAMRADPELRVLVVCGWYDLMCDVAANEQLASRADTAFAGRVTARGLAGGHAVYTDPAARRALTQEVAAFVAASMKR